MILTGPFEWYILIPLRQWWLYNSSLWVWMWTVLGQSYFFQGNTLKDAWDFPVCPQSFGATDWNVNHTEKHTSEYTVRTHTHTCRPNHLTAVWADVVPSDTIWPERPVPVFHQISSKHKHVPVFTMSHTNVLISLKSHELLPFWVFPRPSSTDTAEGMITEVHAPLWRSHYDWFWPHEGWEALLSAHLTLIR